MPHALVLEDDPIALRSLAQWVEHEGFEVTPAETIARARDELAMRSFDLALLDLEVPDGNGVDLLPDLERSPAPEVVFVTGHASVESAVRAFRGGAVDYLTKPIDTSHLRRILGHVARSSGARDDVQIGSEALRRLGRFGPMIGSSAAMQRVYDLCLRVAPTDSTVLVVGDTGTGKELVAQVIHRLSQRSNRPFVPINCGAIAPTLIESELFGHERGSFTGADRRRKGIFEHANGGTLFLDEITEMPMELQVKLLRALETGTVSRVGSSEETPVDVRVIAATNRDLDEAVEAGVLRRDLLYRLLVFPIHLPQLREREGDIALLADAFVASLNARHKTVKRLSAAARELLERQPWPGNVRQLKHAVERAFILAGELIDDEVRSSCGDPRVGSEGDEVDGDPDWLRVRVGASIREVERRLILATLERDRDKRATAAQLGISLKTLYNRLHEYGLM